MQCRNCGDVVDPRRVELGYDYCLKEECQQRCLKRVQLAAVGVNKAADYYMKAEEVLPPRPPAPEADQVAEPEAGDLDEKLEPAEPGPPGQPGRRGSQRSRGRSGRQYHGRRQRRRSGSRRLWNGYGIWKRPWTPPSTSATSAFAVARSQRRNCTVTATGW